MIFVSKQHKANYLRKKNRELEDRIKEIYGQIKQNEATIKYLEGDLDGRK